MQKELNRLAPKRILLIEEHRMVRKAVRKALESYGHLVTAFDTGEKGLDCVAEEQFDAIICNQFLPDISGIDFFSKTISAVRKATKILTSGYADDHLIRLSQALKVDVFLEKPYKIENLVACIERRFDEINECKLDNHLYFTKGGQMIAVAPHCMCEQSSPQATIPRQAILFSRQWKRYTNPDKDQCAPGSSFADAGNQRS